MMRMAMIVHVQWQ